MGLPQNLFADPPTKEVICGRCEQVLYKPMAIKPCGHIFCAACVEGKKSTKSACSILPPKPTIKNKMDKNKKSKKTKQNTPTKVHKSNMTTPETDEDAMEIERKPRPQSKKFNRPLTSCPICESPIGDPSSEIGPHESEHSSTPSNVVVPAWLTINLENMILAFCPMDCGTPSLRLSELADHYIRHCSNSSQPCPHQDAGCEVKVTRRTVEQHMELCHFRLIKCPVCALEMCQGDLMIHQVKRRCAERATKLEVCQTVRKCHADVTSKNQELLRESNRTMQTYWNVKVDHWSRRGVKGFAKGDENMTPFGTPRCPRFYETLPNCIRCLKFFNEKANHNMSCNWHAGPLTENFGGMCLACGKPDYVEGCVYGSHVTKEMLQSS